MKSVKFTVREACTDDLAEVLALYEAAGITSGPGFCESQAKQQFEKISRYPFFRVYVATLDEQIVGTFELILIDNLAKAGAKTALVEDVAVLPTAQRRGVGKIMMVHARDVAKSHGAYKLMLSSNERRQEAHKFYEALGFKRHGVSFIVEL